MGDRTYAVLTITKHDYKELLSEVFGGDEGKLQDKYGLSDIEEEVDEVRMVDYEANYGRIPSLESDCVERGLEYDLAWESGGDYESGEEYMRLIDGELKTLEMYSSQSDIVTEYKSLLKEDPAKLVEIIKKKLLQIEPFEIEPLKPRKINSVEYIKSLEDK